MSPPDPSSCGILQSGMSSQSKRVLVVNNNDEESQVLASLLDGAGYRSTTTWSGLEALELLESQEFDIVLVSSYLPDLYVGDFFERFHRLPVRPCVIVMQEGQAVRSMIGKELLQTIKTGTRLIPCTFPCFTGKRLRKGGAGGKSEPAQRCYRASRTLLLPLDPTWKKGSA